MIKRYIQTIAIAFLVLFSGAQPVHAQLPVTDFTQLTKEWITDALSWFAGSQMLGEMMRGTTDWVNSGFEEVIRTVLIDENGEPYTAELNLGGGSSFVINPNAFFQNLSADSAVSFFSEFESAITGGIETFFSDFEDDLLREIAQEAQGTSESFFDTLVSDFQTDADIAFRDAYLDDFSAGGWDMFLKSTQNCANIYACTRLVTLGEMNDRAVRAREQAEADLAQGGGFLTMRTCAEQADAETAQFADSNGCLRYSNVTPGQLIGEQIAKATTIEFERTENVDELTEAVLSILERVLSELTAMGLSELSNQFAGIDWGGQYENETEDIRNTDPGDLVVPPGGGSNEDGEETDPCVQWPAARGRICTEQKTVILDGETLGQTVAIQFVGDNEMYVEAQKDFGEYNDYVSVTPNPVLLEASEDSQGATVPLTIAITNFDELIEAADDTSEVSGTVSVGPLVIDVSISSLEI